MLAMMPEGVAPYTTMSAGKRWVVFGGSGGLLRAGVSPQLAQSTSAISTTTQRTVLKHFPAAIGLVIRGKFGSGSGNGSWLFVSSSEVVMHRFFLAHASHSGLGGDAYRLA